MNLLLFRHLWGVTGKWEEVFPAFKEAGYQGIECATPPSVDHPRLRRLLDKHNFQFIPQIFSEGESVDEHVASFREQVSIAKTLQPRLINAHSGRDCFSDDESIRYFEEVLKIEADAGVPIAHETHRGRILYNPWTTRRLLGRFKHLKLCCDFSHWVCVCERLIDDQLDIIRDCAASCIHVHARVGYAQGPQVPDPRAPEFRAALEAHERWWRLVWEAQQRRGDQCSTLTPEFGPPDYLHTLPFTGAPVSDLAGICDWQARRQFQNFARLTQVQSV
jgi:sugar phosphate isomerase/epimerase